MSRRRAGGAPEVIGVSRLTGGTFFHRKSRPNQVICGLFEEEFPGIVTALILLLTLRTFSGEVAGKGQIARRFGAESGAILEASGTPR